MNDVGIQRAYLPRAIVVPEHSANFPWSWLESYRAIDVQFKKSHRGCFPFDLDSYFGTMSNVGGIDEEFVFQEQVDGDINGDEVFAIVEEVVVSCEPNAP